MPDIPLVDVVGKTGGVEPLQIGVVGIEKVGLTPVLTVIVSVVDDAHCPTFGAKVYIVVALLFNTGLQVPVIALFEVVGNADKVLP